MSICGRCQARSERPCAYEARTREYFDALIAALRHAAYRCGYALAVHGSLKTDIDLLAAPWRDSAISAASLAEDLRMIAEKVVGHAEDRDGPEQKPCGRVAWAFHLQPQGCEGPYIDLSVMPVGAKTADASPRKRKRRKAE